MLPLVFHVVVDTCTPDEASAWVASSTTTAQAVLGTAGVRLRFDELSPLDDPVGPVIDSALERNALAKYVTPGALHVFVVDGLRDKEDSAKWIAGVHWRVRGRRYVIVSRTHARMSTLAHEIGHHLELRHASGKTNLMNVKRAGDGVLDRRQKQRARRTYRNRYRR